MAAGRAGHRHRDGCRLRRDPTGLGPAGPARRAGRARSKRQFAFAHEWLNERGYRADIPATRRIHPAATDFSAWLERTGATQITAFLDAQDAEGQDA
ncbi:hypothetical protein T261_8421 [Streptomyces lydicus]|nr:hypothetical protein T261_8421 [Streptomyces lydicus]